MMYQTFQCLNKMTMTQKRWTRSSTFVIMTLNFEAMMLKKASQPVLTGKCSFGADINIYTQCINVNCIIWTGIIFKFFSFFNDD